MNFKKKATLDTFSYENEILELSGWLVDDRKAADNRVRNLRLAIMFGRGKRVSFPLDLRERSDVAETLHIRFDNVGFHLRVKVTGFKLARLYLEYFVDGREKCVYLDDMKGDAGKPLFFEYPDSKGAVAIQNFSRIEKAYQDYSDFTSSTSFSGKSVDVIIPLCKEYQNADEVLRSLGGTNVHYRPIVINGCGAEKLSFAQCVNRGLSMAEGDVVLLGSTDLELPDYWLERLMYPIFSDERVASATPYSNAGSLCSFPEIGKDNEVLDNRTVLYMDSCFRGIEPTYQELPNGAGFCMGLSKKAIEEVGLFDETNFPEVAGAEIDWCRRAVKCGFRNVQVENLFVVCGKEGEMGNKLGVQSGFAQNSMERIQKRYPDYVQEMVRFYDADSNRIVRNYAYFTCMAQLDVQTVLHLNHALGGGADDYLKTSKRKVLSQGMRFVEFVYDAYTGNYYIEITYKEDSVKVYSDEMALAWRYLRMVRFDRIYVNELVTYLNIYHVLDYILELKRDNDAELNMLGHDYYAVCPTINLLNDDGNYCNMDCGSCTVEKMECNRYNADAQYSDVELWREKWQAFLEECESVIVFSEDSKRIFEKVYGNTLNICVQPHVTERMLPVRKRYKMSDCLNIATLGVLSNRKGLAIIKQMLEIIEREDLPVNIVVVGTSEEDIAGEHCMVTGRYTRAELPKLMYLYDIDVVFIASVWPETFSFTTEETVKLNMPVALFNMGAPVERVRGFDKCLLIDRIDAGLALEKIRGFMVPYLEKLEIRKKRVLFVVEYESFSSRYRVEHLREALAVQGIYSKTVSLEDVDNEDLQGYDAVSIYRCSKYKLVSKIVEKARSNGIPVIYDIDDYIFNYDDIKDQEFLKGEEYRNFEEYSRNIRKCMEISDFFTTSTYHLKGAIEKSFPDKKTVLIRNSASLEMHLLSEIALDHRLEREKRIEGLDEKYKNGKCVLGYFSGSKTHNKDWELIEDCIIEVMYQREQVELLVVGPLVLSEKFNPFVKRIKTYPFGDWRNLPRLISMVDINLMPLENSFFQWCKSENKWMEAGLVKVPTIASENPEMSQVLQNGENVLLCKDGNEWIDNLYRLIDQPGLRRVIGEAAYRKVTAEYLTDGKKMDLICGEEKK